MLARDGMRNVLAARTVAAFAADVPLGHLLGVDVVVDRVAAVAGGTRGALHSYPGDRTAPTSRYRWPRNRVARRGW